MPPPWEWIESQIIAEFGWPPSVINRESPRKLLEIIRLRSHARAHEEVRKATDPENPPKGPHIDRYHEVLKELVRDIDDDG